VASEERPSAFPICDMIPFAELISAVNHSEINQKAFKQIRHVWLIMRIGPYPSDLGSSPGGCI
jgi:hypothetical protein